MNKEPHSYTWNRSLERNRMKNRIVCFPGTIKTNTVNHNSWLWGIFMSLHWKQTNERTTLNPPHGSQYLRDNWRNTQKFRQNDTKHNLWTQTVACFMPDRSLSYTLDTLSDTAGKCRILTAIGRIGRSFVAECLYFCIVRLLAVNDTDSILGDQFGR